jgi:hypothetical protein
VSSPCVRQRATALRRDQQKVESPFAVRDCQLFVFKENAPNVLIEVIIYHAASKHEGLAVTADIHRVMRVCRLLKRHSDESKFARRSAFSGSAATQHWSIACSSRLEDALTSWRKMCMTSLQTLLPYSRNKMVSSI